ncbi:hypothetical protein MINTM021_50580 [Mycobacterium paraintracellulare]|nr:hypothetical protein MINTM021_50580 [Mycobacterium paraintracellulare]
MQWMPKASDTIQPLSHGAHGRDERSDRRVYAVALQILEDVVTVRDSRNVAESEVKVAIEMFVGTSPNDIIDDLIQVQVRETLWCSYVLDTRGSIWVREQDALKWGHLGAHLPQPRIVHE